MKETDKEREREKEIERYTFTSYSPTQKHNRVWESTLTKAI